MTQEQPGHWLERKTAALDALYHRFGRDGFKDQQLADVQLLLSFKELQFRDAAKGRDLSETQKAANRQLELEINDIRAYVKGYVAGLGGGNFWSQKPREWLLQEQQKHPPTQERGGREGR
jgi:hypothetical protein